LPGQNFDRQNNGVEYLITTRSMMVIDHNEILFRLKNDNFLDGRQVFNFSVVLFYPVNILQGTIQVWQWRWARTHMVHDWQPVPAPFQHKQVLKMFW